VSGCSWHEVLRWCDGRRGVRVHATSLGVWKAGEHAGGVAAHGAVDDKFKKRYRLNMLLYEWIGQLIRTDTRVPAKKAEGSMDMRPGAAVWESARQVSGGRCARPCLRSSNVFGGMRVQQLSRLRWKC
jgi:hypothetical protein